MHLGIKNLVATAGWVGLAPLPLHMKHPRSDDPDDEERYKRSCKLRKQLGPEYLSTRPGPGGAKLTYIEGRNAIELANEVFGYDGWSSEVRNQHVDYCEVDEHGRYQIGVSAIVRVTLKEGNYHEDCGYGFSEGVKQKGASLEKARKEACTDALKRALRMFGNAMGNCIYDKTYLSNIGRMRAAAPPFKPSELYRDQRCIQAPPSASITTEMPAHQTTHQPPKPESKPSYKPPTTAQQSKPTARPPTSTPVPSPNKTTPPPTSTSTPKLPLTTQQTTSTPTTKKQPFFSRPITAPQPQPSSTRRERTPSPIISNDDDDDEPPIVSPVPPNQQLFMRDESFASADDSFFAEFMDQNENRIIEEHIIKNSPVNRRPRMPDGSEFSPLNRK
ncbi:dna repair and recombination protein rad52 [Lichtheimia corymbifera JMRC:FSU:9682]|uniref:Dna repair and recombination protein rad52 n=1 Tax=Lichtheimia corymbifera JMRC:FSU:9682 TaxID=1263082 RepID=A0A068RPX9_9FUNG|nr:dna repair and recombination protein rad52 [Lichtheimia corymbifera JMRC:FSU:9682]